MNTEFEYAIEIDDSEKNIDLKHKKTQYKTGLVLTDIWKLIILRAGKHSVIDFVSKRLRGNH